MYKHKYMSGIKIFSLIINTILITVSLIILLVCLIVDSTKEFKIFFSLGIVILLSLHLIVLNIFNFIFSRYGKSKVIFSKNKIEFKNLIYEIDENYRIIYSKINYDNILQGCPGELILIKNNECLRLGWFTRLEIKKIKHNIPAIQDESKVKK